VTPDELSDVRAGKGYDLAMTARVGKVGVSDGRWASIHHSFGEMLARACADVRVRPGELLGSGTVGGGCLLEVKDQTLGRWLEPGDEVSLRVERLGELRTPVIARPTGA
jgi:fumarylacetoacetate (FAA) hydrolase